MKVCQTASHFMLNIPVLILVFFSLATRGGNVLPVGWGILLEGSRCFTWGFGRDTLLLLFCCSILRRAISALSSSKNSLTSFSSGMACSDRRRGRCSGGFRKFILSRSNHVMSQNYSKKSNIDHATHNYKNFIYS